MRLVIGVPGVEAGHRGQLKLGPVSFGGPSTASPRPPTSPHRAVEGGAAGPRAPSGTAGS